jgi:hypothetical protein
VGGAAEIAVLLAILVAIEAVRAGVRRRSALETKNLGFVAAALDMRLPWTVACLASVPLGTFLRIERCGKVLGVFIVLVKALRRHVFVTGLASLRAYVKRGVTGTLVLLGLL